MFVHVFNKVYFVNKSSDPDLKIHGYVTFDNIENYNELKRQFPSLEIMYNNLSVKSRIINRYNGVHVFILNDGDFIKAINDYCSFLKLDETSIEKLIEHSTNCELYMENCDDISKYNSNVVFRKEDFKITESILKIRSPEIYPGELFINCLDKKIARDKFERFRIYELYNLVKNVQYSCMRKGIEVFEELKLFIYNDDSALLLYNGDIFENVINLLQKLKIDTTKFTVSIEEYMNMDPNFGYNQYHIYKYNYPLAEYLKSTNYKII